MIDNPILPNTLCLGDCLEMMKRIPDGSVDAVICDLPYGSTQNTWDSIITLEPLWAQYNRIVKQNGAMVFTASQPFTSILGASNASNLRYSWVWIKGNATGHLNAKRMPMKNYEDILVFYRKQPTYNPQGLVPYGKVTRRGHNGGNFGKSGNSNMQEFTNYPRLTLSFDYDADKVHPTQKPVALMEYLIRTYTNEGEVVLDNTMGSGTTCLAAKNTGRRYIGIEQDEAYFRIAQQRVEGINAVT